MSLTTCSITLAGTSLVGAKDDKSNYFVSVQTIAEAVDYEDTGVLSQQIRRSKSLETLAGKAFETVNRRIGRTQVKMINARDFSILMLWLSKEGNVKADALLTAVLSEAIERRIDSALQVETSEEEYERRTFEFFRELARKTFLPQFTSHLQAAEVCPNYGAEVNKLKTALALPLQPIDSYTPKQIEQWSGGIIRYDTLRMEGYGHKRTLQRIAHVTQARLG